MFMHPGWRLQTTPRSCYSVIREPKTLYDGVVDIIILLVQAVGIALETKRLDIFNQAILKSVSAVLVII